MAAEKPRRDVVEALTTIAALAAAFLPVAGYLARLIAFLSVRPVTEVALNLAWKTSLADLVVTGAVALLPTLIGILLVAPISRTPNPSPGVGRWMSRALAASIMLVAVVVVPYFPLVVFAGAVGVLTYRFFAPVVRQHGRIVFTEAVSQVAIVMVLGAVTSGIVGLLPGVTVDDFHFSPQVAALTPNGRYVQIGEDGSTLYLEDCQRRLITVDESSVELRRVQKSAVTVGPSLLTWVLAEKAPIIGFVPSC